MRAPCCSGLCELQLFMGRFTLMVPHRFRNSPLAHDLPGRPGRGNPTHAEVCASIQQTPNQHKIAVALLCCFAAVTATSSPRPTWSLCSLPKTPPWPSTSRDFGPSCCLNSNASSSNNRKSGQALSRPMRTSTCRLHRQRHRPWDGRRGRLVEAARAATAVERGCATGGTGG